MWNENSTILVLAPHTDDGELGCGGAVSRLIDAGCDVHYVAFCTCDESLPNGYPNGTLVNELKGAASVFGIKPGNLHVYNFEVRRLMQHRQELLEILVKLNKNLEPNIIFTPSLTDLHQDHLAVAQECRRAFKTKTILSYEMPWNNIDFQANFLITLSNSDIEKKVLALSKYASQKNRPYMQESFIRSLAIMRGTSIGASFAEAFTLERAVV